MAKVRPMLIAALVGGGSATLLRNMYLLGVIVGICNGDCRRFGQLSTGKSVLQPAKNAGENKE